MRRAGLIVSFALLAACSKGEAGGSDAAPPEAIADAKVPCALAGAKDFAPVCTLEQTKRDGAELWIVRHPDGGFRQFQIIENGTRIAAADGAFEVVAARVGSDLEVRVADDRYRFPAAPQPTPSSSDASLSDAPRP